MDPNEPIEQDVLEDGETETEGDQEVNADSGEPEPEADLEGDVSDAPIDVSTEGETPEDEEIEVYEFDEILQMTLTELALLPSTLLHQAVGADRAMIQDLLYSSATHSTAALAGDEAAAKEIAMISATLNDISIKYGIRARVAVQETINRFIFRVIDATLDAAIPG